MISSYHNYDDDFLNNVKKLYFKCFNKKKLYF